MRSSVLSVLIASLCACSPSRTSAGGHAEAPLTDAEYRASIATSMHDALLNDIDALLSASADLQTAAPASPDRGWDATADAAAILATKSRLVSGPLRVRAKRRSHCAFFPQIDQSIDARYDDFLSTLGPSGDQDLFDDQGVTGMHAIERILWADSAPARVVAFEQTLPGYVAASFPTTGTETTEFKTKLCAKLVSDVSSLRDQWRPTQINIVTAFEGLIDLMNEQREKVLKASTDEEESRYSQRTMADLRDNLKGTEAIFGLFEPWLSSKKDAADSSIDGPTIDPNIRVGFATLAAANAEVSGDAIPQPPATWSSEKPSAADLATPFGKLYSTVDSAVDPNNPGSVVSQMTAAASVLELPAARPLT